MKTFLVARPQGTKRKSLLEHPEMRAGQCSYVEMLSVAVVSSPLQELHGPFHYCRTELLGRDIHEISAQKWTGEDKHEPHRTTPKAVLPVIENYLQCEEQEVLEVIAWPPQSPDLSVWDYTKRHNVRNIYL
ncbi:hypothetical protein DNTS_023827 [Danionella cerebrum]|uniref:Uncharacterized protein n=1 Tax=Danionella cerebrum TaxID=2873325 RepID=A0A553QSU0_9TELE|nr:hypothetical protein DNTS_023827 [Danionella translucida]